MHGGATIMTTKSEILTLSTIFAILAIAGATLVSGLTENLLFVISITGGAITSVVGLGLTFLVEQNEKK